MAETTAQLKEQSDLARHPGNQLDHLADFELRRLATDEALRILARRRRERSSTRATNATS